jgi:hypothetical protein
MDFWKKLLGIKKSVDQSVSLIQPKPNIGDRIKHLWENANKIGWSKSDCEKKIQIYTELLGLVEKDSDDASASFRNRAVCYRGLEKYDEAITDLTCELEIHKRRGKPVLLCNYILQECRGLKRKAEAKVGSDTKSRKIREMVQLVRNLRQTGAEFEAAFQSLFSYLHDKDPDIREEASRILADSENGPQKLVSIYESCIDTDSRKSVLAGRVLGRWADAGKGEMIHAVIARAYGIQAAFTPCVCAHCGKLNIGIPVPEGGLYIPFYARKDDKSATYALPVLCDYCGKEFFIAWDSDPR